MAAGVIGLGFAGSGAGAKEPSLTAIELYDGASGPAYVQLADVLINGKAELRNCVSAQANSIDKSEFGKLPKVTLSPGGVLERGEDGVLRYGNGESQGSCAVPENVKFEHNTSFAPASIADMVDLRGRAIAPGSDGAAAAQPLKKGVKLVFVSAPDVEKAEFLLAERISTQDGWQKYLATYPASPNTGTGKRVLAALYLEAGEKAYGSYQKTPSGTPSYSDLKAAKAQVDQAHALLPNSEGEIKLGGEIRSSLSALADRARAELDAYSAALASSSAGFVHLSNARGIADAIAGIDPGLPALNKLQVDIVQASNGFESAMRSAESAAAAKHWDDAVKAVHPYRAFAGEEPRVARIIDDAYAAYFVQAQQLDATKDWANAISAYKSALKAKETPEASDSLKAAEKEYQAAQNEAAARAALDKSKTYEQQKDLIPAYEVLASLSDSQQVIVKEDIERLAPGYIQAASQRAKEIAKEFNTIQGIGDEIAIENAYSFLQRASALSETEGDKQSFDLRLQNLGDELSAWFLDRAKHSLEKPLGSGTEIGWEYLKEAESYKAANLEAVRDQMKMADAAHGMHSRLSIRVQFRDQTSQRQSEGFATQMESAIAADLDSSGIPVKIIRSGDAARQAIETDFLIAGDILEKNVSMPATVESVDSQYRASTHEVPNEEWNKINRVYESANNELQTARAALQGAEAKGNKKTVQDVSRQVEAAQKKADDVRVQLDATPKSKTEDVIRSYTYKRTTYNVVNRIVLQFRIDDAFSGQKGDLQPVAKEQRKQSVVTSEVKSEDTNKVKDDGAIPDKEELQNELENLAREELIKKVRDRVSELPHKLYDDAQKREADGNPDDAGEAYLRYLNVSPADQQTEREHAQKFLHEHFNFQLFPGEIHENRRQAPALEQGMAQPAK